jgi:hypothetical protein
MSTINVRWIKKVVFVAENAVLQVSPQSEGKPFDIRNHFLRGNEVTERAELPKISRHGPKTVLLCE